MKMGPTKRVGLGDYYFVCYTFVRYNISIHFIVNPREVDLYLVFLNELCSRGNRPSQIW